jgi:hypothetical protein
MPKFLKTWIAIIATLLLASTTGCAQLPRDGQIQIGPDLQSGLESDYLYYSPGSPVAGSTPDEILAGFLNAGTGPQNDYATAREYLSSDLKANWVPNKNVLIQEGRPEITFDNAYGATVKLKVKAEVDAQGQYTQLPNGTTRELHYKLALEADEWRIASAPDLTMVIQPVFDVIFHGYSLYFFDNQFQHLVPDLRWFPSRASTSTRLIAALLDGPSSWLRPGVKTAIPSGTKLSLSAVAVANGVATVDLSNTALQASASERKFMMAQITETLMQLSNVLSVQLLIERAPQDILAFTNPNRFGFANQPVILQNSNLIELSGSNSMALSEFNTPMKAISPSDFAITSDRKRAVFLNGLGLYAYNTSRVGTAPQLLLKAKGLLAPIIDSSGFIWAVPKDKDQPVSVFNANGEPVGFYSGWLNGRSRAGFSLSPEGSRVILTSAGGSVYAAVVIRDKNGVPIGLGDAIEPFLNGKTIRKAVWLKDSTVAMLHDDGNNMVTPIIATLGGASFELPAVAGATNIASTSSVNGFYVHTIDGELYFYRNSSWMPLREDVVAIHVSSD